MAAAGTVGLQQASRSSNGVKCVTAGTDRCPEHTWAVGPKGKVGSERAGPFQAARSREQKLYKLQAEQPFHSPLTTFSVGIQPPL